MRSELIAFQSPSLCEYLCLLQACEDLSIEQFVPEFPIEGFIVSVLPGTAGFDEQILDPELFQPLTNRLCGKLWSVVRPEMDRKAFLEKLFSWNFHNILSLEVSPDLQRQAFPAVFIDQGQDPERTAIMGSLCHKIIRPDMVSEKGSQAHAGPVIEP